MEETRDQEPGFLFRLMFLCGICMFFVACASKPEKNFVYSPTANPSDELRILRAEMEQAESEQIAVFAPRSYTSASKSWVKAKDYQERGKSNEQVLKELANARAEFEQAKIVANRSLKALPEIADARENALIAGAAIHHRNDLQKADEKLMNNTDDFERSGSANVSQNDRSKLRQMYLELEVKGLKTTRLGDAQSMIAGAKKMGAERYAPKSYKKAQAKLANAEKIIEADRRNDALITATATDVTKEAQRLLKVTKISKQSGGSGNEPLAIQIVAQEERINRLNEDRALQAAKLEAARRATGEARRSASTASKKLSMEQNLSRIYANAQNRFAPEEADVYRQGDNLIVRLKSIRFPTGGSDIPSASFKVLNKAKDIIQEFPTSRVVVEGHTDATGSASVNQKLSQERAESVAQFLEQDLDRRSGGVEAQAPEIEAQGYGFQYPIVTNRTSEGRAQNRRVDLVIMPESAE
ncbi:MAG: OmpA family protein [Pseudobdellovibrionaceae bacterium]